jgi:hypothetical protein
LDPINHSCGEKSFLSEKFNSDIRIEVYKRQYGRGLERGVEYQRV